ncbi:hypothetical protein ACQ4WP_05570 [Janthinobacterium sp. GB4P2]|uniref:hypothetical protein n=1 Tax=Janthinobacterium sp. GB4P2 TaxID=3424189 RepID=UPI003F27A364
MWRWTLGTLVLMVCLSVSAATGGGQEVTLAVTGGVLHGKLSLPKAQGKVPVVLLHAGSGQADRHGNSAMLPGHNDAQYRPSVQPYLISSLTYPPRDAAAAPTAQLLIVPGMNHVLKMVSGDLAQKMPSYGDPALPPAPALVDAVTAFVQER